MYWKVNKLDYLDITRYSPCPLQCTLLIAVHENANAIGFLLRQYQGWTAVEGWEGMADNMSYLMM